MTTNAGKVADQLERSIRKMDKGSGKEVRAVSEWGKYHAKRIAPNDTGATIRAIKWTKGRTPKSATIIFGNGHKEDRPNFNLTYYMNYTKNARDVWHSGNRYFIITTAEETRKRFGRGMRRVVNAFVDGK